MIDRHPPSATELDFDSSDTRTVATLSAAHFVHDSYPAFIGILLPLLMVRLDIGLAAAGVLASAVRWTALLQPATGHMADRRDSRRWVVVAPALTAICICALVFAPSVPVAVGLLLVTGLSHAAFHPAAGAMVTRLAGGRWGRATAFFMTGGELGRAVGPLFIAGVIGLVGIESAWIAVAPGLAIAVIVHLRVRGRSVVVPPRASGHLRSVVRSAGRSFWLLAATMILRSVATASFLVFFPTFSVGLGLSLVGAGVALAAYELAGTAGALMGGLSSDRIGRRPVLIAGLAVGLPVMLAGLLIPPGIVQIGLFALSGFCLLSATPVQLVAMQEMLPEHRSVAVGLTYFMTTSGAIVATLVVGAIGEASGLSIALPIATLTAALALPLLLALRLPSPPTGVLVPSTVALPHTGAR